MLCLTLTLAKTVPDSQGPEIVGQLVESLTWRPDGDGGAGTNLKATGRRQVQGHLASADETGGVISSAARSGTCGEHLVIIPARTDEFDDIDEADALQKYLCQ